MPGWSLHSQKVPQAKVPPALPPFRVQRRVFGSHQPAPLLDEPSDQLQLHLTQALLIGQDQHAVLGKISEVVVKDDIEGYLRLNQDLLEEHGALPRPIVV